jgi:hypothetical protein
MCLVCRTIGLPDYWTVGLPTVGLLDCRIIRMLDYRSDPYCALSMK